jgi:iron complex transport system substrate-binding protein
MRIPIRRRAVGALLVPIALAACGSDAPDNPSGASSTTTTATTAAASTTAMTTATSAAASSAAATTTATTATTGGANAAKRIVSLSPTATESLFAIGAGPQVVAVDDQSNYPAQAPRTDLSGYKPNVEAIAAKSPDLVVIADDSAKLSDALGALKIKVLVQPPAKTFDDVYAQIGELGKVTGHDAEAAKLAAGMKADLGALAASAPKKKGLTYYHELDDTYYSVTSKTFAGQVYGLFGLTSIADAADKDGSGFPQLSAEAIITANPDLVFLADTKCCKQTPATVAGRPGWSALKAVTNKAVIGLDDDVASRWGPRIVDFAKAIAAALPPG